MIGSGPGGYTAAFRAADLGLKVTLVEKYETLGGVCLNVGCIPSKALLHAARVIAESEEMGEHGVVVREAQGRSAQAARSGSRTWSTGSPAGSKTMAKQRKVEVVTGVAKFTGPKAISVDGREIGFDSCIIAVGSCAVKLPFLPEDPRIIDSTGALSPDEVPRRFLVIGGGIIGLEMATVYHALGAKVTVVEMQDQLIPGADADIVRPLHKRVQERYEAILLKTQVTGCEGVQRRASRSRSRKAPTRPSTESSSPWGAPRTARTLEADKAGVNVDERGFIAVDRQMRTNVPGIYAIGDIVGNPMLAHKATHEAKTAAEVIAGVPGAEFDALAIPSVAYTDPEVAWMGLTETEAKAQGIKYEKASFPWVASGRALGLGRPEGSTKLLFDPASDPPDRRRHRRRRRRRPDRRDGARDRGRTQRPGHRAGDPPAPDPLRDDRVRRRDAGRHDHRPAAAQEAALLDRHAGAA